MSENSLEDRMLQSAFDNFMSLCNGVESKMSENDSIYEISNQIEILKEVFIKAEFQLECYRCHQKLLLNDQIALKKTKTSVSEELNLINSRKKIVDNKNTEVLLKENQNLKEQIEIYSGKIDNSVNLKEQLSSFLTGVKREVLNKSAEIETLSEIVENKREKSTNANNSLSKQESDKSLYLSNEKKKGIGKFFSGIFRRNA